MIILVIPFLFALLGLTLFFKKQAYRYIGLAIFFAAGLVMFNVICVNFSATFLSRTLPRIINYVTAIGFLYFIIIEFKILKSARKTQFHNVDYLIVNGAKLYRRSPSPSLQDRLDGTLSFMQSNQNSIAVLTGKKWPYSDISEAQFMYEWLIEHNIPQNRLVLEENASNTLENIRFSLERIKQSAHREDITIGILTSDYHLHRALYIAKKEHVCAVGFAVPTKRLLSKINYFIREAFAMTEIYVFGVEGI